MRRAVINSKGRVTIPAELRRKLGLDPGTHVRSQENEKLVLTPMTTRRVREVRGSPEVGQRLTTDDGL
jgi:AbrB family looped-hinge helix DNA binding protein